MVILLDRERKKLRAKSIYSIKIEKNANKNSLKAMIWIRGRGEFGEIALLWNATIVCGVLGNLLRKLLGDYWLSDYNEHCCHETL